MSALKSMIPGFVRSGVRSLRGRCDLIKGGLRQRYETLLCRYYYGNTVQYWANVKGNQNWTAARKAFRKGIDPELHGRFMQLGYANLTEAANMKLIDRFRQAFLKAMADPEQSFNPFADPESLKYYNHGNYQGPLGEYRRHVKDSQRTFPEHATLLEGRLGHLIQSCLGSDFAIESVHGYRNNYCPPHIVEHFEPHASRWHFDDQLPDGMRLFLYLTDVTENHGPFQCFDRSYSRYLLRKGFSKDARKFSVTGGLAGKLFDTPRLASHTGPAGSMILCASSYCLHRAAEMLGPGNHRDVLVYNLRPCVTAQDQVPTHRAAA